MNTKNVTPESAPATQDQASASGRVFVPSVDALETKASTFFETVSFLPENSYAVDEHGIPKVTSAGTEDPDEEL